MPFSAGSQRPSHKLALPCSESSLMKIASVVARQLLDCKARPLVEVEITTDTGHVGRGASPAGSSVGVHEAFVLRDGDPAEYNGLSVHGAVSAVTDEISPVLV